MSYLLFMDESGHDHKHIPYEVRGGIAVSDHRLWGFIRDIRSAEIQAFGSRLQEYGTETKGKKLLKRRRFEWAAQQPLMQGEQRRARCRTFLQKGLRGERPDRDEFTAYGQGSLFYVLRIFEVCISHRVLVFASCIPQGQRRQKGDEAFGMLRKDLVYLLERFFLFLESRHATVRGLLVMDETERKQGRRLIARMDRYFSRTHKGRQRAGRIIPSPFFVSSHTTDAVQVADVIIYCINWAYRIPDKGMDEPVRKEIADMYLDLIQQLVFRGTQESDGKTYPVFGVTYVPDPFSGHA